MTGEPGIGKTALVRAFTRSLGDRARVLFGACDDLVTPRPLGPFHDLESAAPALGAALASPTPADVHRALLGEFVGGPAPVVVVIEDAHWADEATIDTLTWLVRRVEELSVTVVLTYRDGAVIGAHPLLPMLGSIPPAIARHIRLQPLSTAAVAELVGPDRAEEVTSATGGIPFFVSEIAALDPSAVTDLPASVTHAVLARIARLPNATRNLLDHLAVEPSRTATSLLDRLQPDWAIPEPHLAELEGRWGDAAIEWRALGMPYEALALARIDGDGRIEARAIAERLGATPLLRRLGQHPEVPGTPSP